jgi:hypothetical protein
MIKKNIQNLLKRELELFPLIAYFIFYLLYLFFDVIVEQKDYAALVKPIFIPIIAFLYVTNKNSKRTILNLIILVLIFISDNSTLLEIRSFHIYSTIIYVLVLSILLFYAILDMKYFLIIQKNKNKFGIILVSIFILILCYWSYKFDPTSKQAEIFIIYEYMIVSLFLIVISFTNFLKINSNTTKYLFLTILCMFLSEFCFSLKRYYDASSIFIYLFCFVEVPIYYFLLKYLIAKDMETIEQ